MTGSPSGRACPACGARAPDAFFHLRDLPVHGTAVFPNADLARAVVTADQALTLCDECGLIFNQDFDPTLLDYGGTHEESQHHSPRFAAYAAELSAIWVGRYGLAGRTVVEVGCGAGDFATALLDAGVAAVTGIDPHFRPERVPPALAGRLHAVAAMFDPSQVDPGTAALVCRHTIEHVPDLAAFGASLRDAGAPVLLAEVPDVGRILDEGAFWDLQYEHCSNFTPATFAGYLRGCGFVPAVVRTTYEDQYVVIEAVPGEPRRQAETEVVADLRRRCTAFARQVGGQLDHWATWFDERATAGDDVVVWGGGSKGLTFLGVLTPYIAPVQAVVDVNPGLQGNHLGGTGLPIVAPVTLREEPPRSVVLMNPVYTGEVRAMLDDLGLGATELLAL